MGPLKGPGSSWPRAYATAVLGVALVTAGIAVVLRLLAVPNLSVVYVLLVLWLGSRFGRGPAVAASLLAFLAYDYFFVQPVGTLSVAGPSQLLELVLLLAAALVTGQLVANLERARGEAAAAAVESRTLYELATAALRLPELAAALDLVCGRATALPGVTSFGLLSFDRGSPERVAGAPATAEEARQAARTFRDHYPVGCSLQGGVLRLLASRPPREQELVMVPLTSGVVVARVRVTAVEGAQLRLLAALIALADLLLERRRAAVESDRRRAVESSDELKSALLSSLSHELRSPIASLRAGLTALATPLAGLAPEQREIIEGLDRQAIRLDRLVGDLLAMSRLEAGERPRLEPCTLPEVLGGVLRRLRQQLTAYSVRVEVRDDLPPVMADELQLDRVLTNLLENAIDWTPPGGAIEVGASAREGELAVWVANEGPEIPVQELERLFDKFWTRRPAGSGLGLAICKRIVEAHGGSIEVRNLRPGPRFLFTLRRAAVAAPGR